MNMRDIPGFEEKYAVTEDGYHWEYYGRGGDMVWLKESISV